MQKITILLDTDADPSDVLDAAYEVAEELADILGCRPPAQADGVSVEYA
jgi:hypothetical protein